jgi:ABC-type glycerol-3-phosphate transport system substrate-binding protein
MVLLAFLALSGCSQPDEVEPSPTPVPNSIPIPVPQPLVIWHGLSPLEHEALQHIADRFAETQPDIAIQVEAHDAAALLPAFEKAVMDGAGPDIVLGPMAWVPPLAEKGIIQPLSSELVQMMADTLPLPVAQSTLFTDTPYALPISAEFTTLYTNRALVDEPPQIWDQVAPAAQQSGLLVAPTFLSASGLYFTSGSRLKSADGTSLATRPAMERFLTDLQTLAGQPGVTFTYDSTAFAQGEAGMLLASSSEFATLHAALGDDLSVAALPRIPPNQWSTLLEFTVLMQSLNSTAEAVQATRTFAEFVLSPAIQRVWFEETGHAPVNPSGLAEPSLRAAWANTLEWGTPAPLNSRFEAELGPALDRAVQAIVSEGQTVEEGAAIILAILEDGSP